jgi:hypothetical protein
MAAITNALTLDRHVQQHASTTTATTQAAAADRDTANGTPAAMSTVISQLKCRRPRVGEKIAT